jgi:hypothetical protein
MELDISHGLAKSVRHLDTSFQLSQTNANRWAASQKEVEAMEALYRGGRVALNDVLEAQRRRAIAQFAFWQSVTEYNKAIADLHTRKGSIMEYNGICFEEGPWVQKAYWDAHARARERDAGTYIDYGWTRPKVVSRGEMPQHAPGYESFPLESIPGGAEEIQSPEPTPAAPPTAGESEPEPMPMPMPLETRVRPLSPSRPRISAAHPVSPTQPATSTNPVEPGAESGETKIAAATSIPPSDPAPAKPASAKPIAPVTYHSTAGGVVNPLRSSR